MTAPSPTEPNEEQVCVAEGHWTTVCDDESGWAETVHDPDEGPCEFGPRPAPGVSTSTAPGRVEEALRALEGLDRATDPGVVSAGIARARTHLRAALAATGDTDPGRDTAAHLERWGWDNPDGTWVVARCCGDPAACRRALESPEVTP